MSRRNHNRISRREFITKVKGHRHHGGNVEHLDPRYLRKLVKTEIYGVNIGSYKQAGDFPDIEIGKNVIIDTSTNYALIYDPVSKNTLLQYGFLGSPIGHLQLEESDYTKDIPVGFSVYDILFAYELGLITPDQYHNYNTGRNELIAWGKKHDDEDFLAKYSVYRSLRKNGILVMNGHSLGVDFLLYKTTPVEFLDKGRSHEHSFAIVHVVTDLNKFTAQDAIQKERLARKTNRKFIIMVAKGGTKLKRPTDDVSAWQIVPSRMGIDVSEDTNALILRRIVQSEHYDIIPFELAFNYRRQRTIDVKQQIKHNQVILVKHRDIDSFDFSINETTTFEEQLQEQFDNLETLRKKALEDGVFDDEELLQIETEMAKTKELIDEIQGEY